MNCKHLRQEYPRDDFINEIQWGRCRDCGSAVWGKGFAWLDKLDEKERRNGKYNYDIESKAQEKKLTGGMRGVIV